MKKKNLFVIAGIIILIVIVGIVAISIFSNSKIPELYQQKIDEYAEAMSVGQEVFGEKYNDDSSINCTIAVSDYYSYGNPISYTIKDIDDNGIDELIFSNNGYEEACIVDIYTISDNRLIKMFQNASYGYREFLQILDDGTLLEWGSSGAGNANCAIYTLNEKSVPRLEKGYYYDLDGWTEYDSKYTMIDSSRFSEFLDEYLAKSIFNELKWTVIEPKNTNQLETEEQTTIEVEKVSDYDKLINAIQGYWGTPKDYGYYDCVSFNDNQVSYGSTAPHGGIRPSEITEVTRNADGTFGVLVYYPEIEMYDELEPAMEEYKIFSSNDNFTNSLIIKSDGYTTEYFYAGETYVEFERKCEEKIKKDTQGNYSSSSSESNYDKYRDKTVQDIRNEYGQEKESWIANQRKVLVYDDPIIPQFYYSFHLGSNERALEALKREPVAPPNVFVTGFVASAKGTEVYKGIKIGDNFNKATNLIGAITELESPIAATSYPGNGRIDWILDDKGTILYASVTYGH